MADPNDNLRETLKEVSLILWTHIGSWETRFEMILNRPVKESTLFMELADITECKAIYKQTLEAARKVDALLGLPEMPSPSQPDSN